MSFHLLISHYEFLLVETLIRTTFNYKTLVLRWNLISSWWYIFALSTNIEMPTFLYLSSYLFTLSSKLKYFLREWHIFNQSCWRFKLDSINDLFWFLQKIPDMLYFMICHILLQADLEFIEEYVGDMIHKQCLISVSTLAHQR